MPDALSRSVELVEINFKTTQDDWYLKMVNLASKKPLDKYKLENGLLYHRLKFSNYSGDRLWTLCVPEEDRKSVLEENHDHCSHPGIWKTHRKISQSYYWPNMLESVYKYINKCELCHRIKSSNENTRTPTGEYREPKEAGRQLSIDFIGKLPLSKSGNQWIFVVMDCYSRYTWVKPMRTACAMEVVHFLRTVVFPANGCPEIIISDNGKQFISQTFEQLCTDYHIRHMKTPFYHPQANQVEATNKTIKSFLRARMANVPEHSVWESFLTRVVLDINTMPHTSTNYSPYFLHCGREFTRDGREFEVLVDVNPHTSREEDRMKSLRDEVRDRQFDTYRNSQRRVLPRTRIRKFKVGDEVYIPNNKLSSAGDRYNSKLAPKKIRAYVSRIVGSDSYELIDGNRRIIGNYIPCQFDNDSIVNKH